jgi:hypothetical protein
MHQLAQEEAQPVFMAPKLIPPIKTTKTWVTLMQESTPEVLRVAARLHLPQHIAQQVWL